MGPNRENAPPKPEPHAKDARPRHIVDMIIGGEIPQPELMHLETSSSNFRWTDRLLPLLTKTILWGPMYRGSSHGPIGYLESGCQKGTYRQWFLC